MQGRGRSDAGRWPKRLATGARARLGGRERVSQQHRDRHRPDAPGHGCDRARDLAHRGHYRIARDVAIVGSTAWLLAQGGKTRVKRARPYEADGVIRLIRPPTGSSYPSGHAAVAAAMMSVVAAEGPARLRATCAALAAFVGCSRIYVGVHYPSDVVGGAGIGLLLAAGWRSLRRAFATW